jgi:D-xylose transport system permease protein
MTSTLINDPRLIAQAGLAGIRRRLTSGDIGQLPVIIGLALIWGIFGWASNLVFFKPENMVDLSNQMAATGTIAIGVVFILLLGEIDLTVGVVSGLCAAVMAVANVHYGLPPEVSIILGIFAGACIGLLQGFWFARVGIPSFVVTLAGLLGWQGVQLWVLGSSGVVNLRDPFILTINSSFYFHDIWAFVIGLAFIGYVALTGFWGLRARRRAGLTTGSASALVARVVGLAILVLIPIWWLLHERGLPLSLVIMVTLIVIVDYVLRRTRFGRMVFAVGGNVEAARRAGIPVARVRMACFVLCSSLAAWGGIMAASRGLNVNQNSGGATLLLYAIASAVIGGTSLFGGRGSAWAALLGVLVIQSIVNGMTLISINSDMQYIITGVVLLAAVTIDAVIRRGRPAVV